MEALVIGKGTPVPESMTAFNETPAEHMQRVHPDPVATNARRMDLERQVGHLIALKGCNDE